MPSQPVDKDLIRQLLDGTISKDDAERLLKMERKDAERFESYIAVLQETVPWKDRILLRLNDKLFVVLNDNQQRVVKCACGVEFGDYRENWKLKCRVRVRKTQEQMLKVYDPAPGCPEAGWQEVREFICPCPEAAQMAVEVVPPGYPVVFEMLPDLDTFYREVIGKPLPDQSAQWYEDRSTRVTASWAAHNTDPSKQ